VGSLQKPLKGNFGLFEAGKGKKTRAEDQIQKGMAIMIGPESKVAILITRTKNKRKAAAAQMKTRKK
jgi:hypothetical protein